MPTPLKVTHIVSGDLWAGAEAQVLTLLKQLKQHENIHLQVIILNHGELANRLLKAGIQTSILDEQELSSPAIAGRLLTLFNDFQPDVIHSHRKKENILSALANLGSVRCASVSTIHGAQEHSVPWTQPHKALVNFINWGCYRFINQRIIAVSGQLATELAGQFPVKQIATIVNGIDTGGIMASARETAPPFQDQKLHVGIVGRLEPVKRVDLFIDTAKALIEQHPEFPWHFDIIGDGSQNKAISEQVKQLDLGTQVSFHGHLNNSHAHIQALDILLMCSDHEGLPMTVLEAMTLGTPVVAHAVGGLMGLLKDQAGGELVYQHTPEAYAQAIYKLVKQAPEDLIEKGKKRVSSKYSAQANASAVIELYRELCSTKQSPHL